MKKSWTIILIFCIFLALGLSLHFGIFDNLLSKTPFVKNIYNNSILTINTRGGPARILLNGIDYGETPTSISSLSEGEYLVELEKITETPEIYPKQSFYIELYRSTEAVVDIEIAPENFKSGHILYYLPMARTLSKKGAVTIRSEISNYEVSIDGIKIDQETIVSYQLEPKEYDVVVSANGYESLKFPMIVREGYNLNIRVYLLPIPVNF